MLNSVGLENPGVEAFVKTKLPGLQSIREGDEIGPTALCANISGFSLDEFRILAEAMEGADGIDAIAFRIPQPASGKLKSFITPISKIGPPTDIFLLVN